MTPNPAASTGNITRADVVLALGDTDPNKTNSNVLRAAIGRGSASTIQKHLNDIRAERAPQLPAAPGAVPVAPPEVVTTLWTAAWSQAQLQTLGRLESVTAERDACVERAATLARDLDALAAEIDSLNEQIEQAKTMADAAQLAHAAAISEADAVKAKFETTLSSEQHEIERLKAAAAAAEMLAASTAALKDEQHKSAINHLLDQVAELKSALHSRNAEK